jgi:hypothetical protein
VFLNLLSILALCSKVSEREEGVGVTEIRVHYVLRRMIYVVKMRKYWAIE